MNICDFGVILVRCAIYCFQHICLSVAIYALIVIVIIIIIIICIW